ncbi:DUF397 domain-containing protein [Streptomyces sp. NPDC053427]|uniref:DUF397 domain-containing protein n=1 Tax=Streptomyces sp. NPDC053427 TaxID=3365701 RepID=UPI0037CEB065
MREYNLSSAQWRKSSYSDGHGGDCIEVAHDFPGAAHWRKSSYSDHNGGDCLEVRDDRPGVVPVRDSKDPHGPVLVISAASWSTFVNSIKTAPSPAS